MAKSRYIILILIATSFGCGQTTPNQLSQTTDSLNFVKINLSNPIQDTSNQAIYDFMKVVMQNQKLDLSYGLTIEPELNCDLFQDDKIFLKSLIIKKQKFKKKVDNTNWRTEIITINPFEFEKCLTNEDVDNMLLKKEKLSSFKWDNSRLNFNLKNVTNWYCFSIPLFSKDKTKAIMIIRNLCKGLCGTDCTVLFQHKNNEWKSQIGAQWIH